jgi:hypothetical protein
LNQFPRATWALISWSSESFFYLKRTAKNKNYISSNEFKLLQPEVSDPDATMTYLKLLFTDQAMRKAVQSELLRSAEMYPLDWKVHWYMQTHMELHVQ